MKNRLNITVDDALIEQVKRYAAKHHVSLSQLIEQYFKTLTRPAAKENILDFLEKLPKRKSTIEGDSRKAYYAQRKKKYGF